MPAAAVLEVVRAVRREGRQRAWWCSPPGSAKSGDGAAPKRELRDLARRHGMRLVGPNCLGRGQHRPGSASTPPSRRMRPSPGRIAMQSQSGALGIAILERSARIGLGVSSFVSVGNKADVSGNDLLQYWEDDPGTDVVLLYLESFGNPRKFARIARRVSRRKPIVAVKSGRSAGGRPGSVVAHRRDGQPRHRRRRPVPPGRRHPGRHPRRAASTWRCVLGSQPLPAGRRVAIVGNSGGPGILATDACDGAGLEVPELSAATQAGAARGGRPGRRCPTRSTWWRRRRPTMYEQALRIVLADDAVDAAIVICTPTFAARPPRIAEVLRRRSAATTSRCSAASSPGRPPTAAPRGTRRPRGRRAVPAFAFPEPAAQALARAAGYAELAAPAARRSPDLDGFDSDAHALARRRVPRRFPDGGWLDPGDARTSCSPPAGCPRRAARGRRRCGGRRSRRPAGVPGGAQSVGRELVHKTDVGGVRLGLGSDAEEVADAYDEMAMVDRIGDTDDRRESSSRWRRPAWRPSSAWSDHPLFGPLVMFGIGGIATELLGDRSFRILPVTDLDAAELVRSLRASPLLFGYRGSPADRRRRPGGPSPAAVRPRASRFRSWRRWISTRSSPVPTGSWPSTGACG